MSEDQLLEAESYILEKNIEVLPHDVELATTQSQKTVQCLPFIHSLSDDLIFEIFLIFVVQSNSAEALRSSPPAQFILSMICWRWRDIVIHSPLLWTDIFFPTNPKYDTLIFFERSCPAPINVNFDSVSSQLYDNAALPRFAQSLIKHISRLRSLTIIVSRLTDVREFWSALKSLEALHLQTLNIQLSKSNCYDTLSPHTPLRQGGGSVRSLNVRGLCFHCLPLLSGITKLEIDCVALNSRDFQAILNNYPSLSTLVIGHFTASFQYLRAPFHDQTPHPAQVLAPSLRSLAIRIDNSHSSECTCALPWLVMDNLEYLEMMFPLYTLNTHHSSILSRLKSVPRLRKLRFYGILGHLLNSDKTFFSSLPNNTDLECVYYPDPEPGHPALSEILAMPHFRSITFDLTPHLSSQFGHFIDLDEFVLTVSCTELKSPIIIRLPTNTPELDTIKSVLSDKLSVHAFPGEKGLLDNHLSDYGGDGDEFELDPEDETEDEFVDEYEFEDEDEFEDEFGDEFEDGLERFSDSD